jgi:hypothetical protein
MVPRIPAAGFCALASMASVLSDQSLNLTQDVSLGSEALLHFPCGEPFAPSTGGRLGKVRPIPVRAMAYKRYARRPKMTLKSPQFRANNFS